MMTRKYLPLNGPAWSISILDYGRDGHSQGWIGALVGNGRFVWHISHCCTIKAMLVCSPSHHTYDPARLFMILIPGWDCFNTIC